MGRPAESEFNATATGATSTDSPKYVIVSNIGNGALLLAGATDPTYPADFPKGGSATPVCATGNSIFLVANCYVGVNFTPVNVGPLSENVALINNDLYVSGGVTQNIAVSGTATGLPAPTVNWGPLSGINYGTALSSGIFNATFTTLSTNLTNDGTITYYVGSVGGTVVTSSTILPAGSDTLCVQWVPGGEYSGSYSSASLCLPITVNVAATSISWAPVSPIVSPSPLGSAQFNASASFGSTSVSSDGTFTYYVARSAVRSRTPARCCPWASINSACSGRPHRATRRITTPRQLHQHTVNAATSISWTPATPITYRATLGSGQFNATASRAQPTSALTARLLTMSARWAEQWPPAAPSCRAVPILCACSGRRRRASRRSTAPRRYACPSQSTQPPLPSVGVPRLPPSSPPRGRPRLSSTPLHWPVPPTSPPTARITYQLSTAGGTVITTGATLPLAANTICAVWAPSSGYALDYTGHSTCQSFTVINTQPTTTTVARNTNPVFLTNAVTFTATVTPTSGTIVPTGTVTFFDGIDSIGTGTLSASGSGASAIARLTTTSLATGSHAMTANYPGDTNNQASSTPRR